MNRSRSLILLIGVFAALIVISLLVQIAPPAAPQISTTPFYQRVYPDLEPESITAVSVTDSQGEGIVLRYDAANEHWVFEATGAIFSTEVAENVTSTLSILPYLQTLPAPTEAELRTYGLTQDRALLIAAVTDEGQTHAVLVGLLTPASTSYYVLVDQRPEVYLVERAAIDYIAAVTRSAYGEARATSTP